LDDQPIDVLNECDNAAIIHEMEYAEVPPPDDLRYLIKGGWTLSVPAAGPKWVTHVATPDGCMEIIRRVDGQSRWDGEQPACFVAGALTRPAMLALSSGSRFVAIRIWPWTWQAISGHSPAELVDTWADLSAVATDFTFASAVDDLFAALRCIVADAPSTEFIEAILASRTCREASERTGLSARALQRWFERHVGQPPRTYLRLLRFSDALAHLPATDQSLAAHAVDHGFADQAHMAREFRSLAGTPASRARDQGQGPFIGVIH
jgi:AraC-like DNA-binding protein